MNLSTVSSQKKHKCHFKVRCDQSQMYYLIFQHKWCNYLAMLNNLQKKYQLILLQIAQHPREVRSSLDCISQSAKWQEVSGQSYIACTRLLDLNILLLLKVFQCVESQQLSVARGIELTL